MPEPIIACGCTRKFLGMKYHMILLNIGGKPRKNHTGTLGFPKRTNTRFSRCPKQFTQMCIKVATLILSKIITSGNLHESHKPILVYEHAKQYMSITYSRGDQGNRFLPQELQPKPQVPNPTHGNI